TRLLTQGGSVSRLLGNRAAARDCAGRTPSSSDSAARRTMRTPLHTRFGAGKRALHGLRKTRLLTQGGSVSRLLGNRAAARDCAGRTPSSSDSAARRTMRTRLHTRFGAGKRALHGLRKTRLLTQGGSVWRLLGTRAAARDCAGRTPSSSDSAARRTMRTPLHTRFGAGKRA